LNTEIKVISSVRTFVEKNIARKNETRRGKYWAEEDYRKDQLRKSTLGHYKVTPEAYNKQLAEQEGHCALCSATHGKKRLHQDHDHKCCNTKRTCGKCNRGIICQVCNTRLGYLEQTLREALAVPVENTWTSRAIAYLDSYKRTP
jgi:hypothetical protein